MNDMHVERVEVFNEKAQAGDWSARCDPTLALESSALSGLLAVWRGKAVSGLPPREAMSLRALKPYLINLAIIEREGARYRVRLMGTLLAQMLGDMQGHYLDETIRPELLERWTAALDLTLAEQRPLRFINRVSYKNRNDLQAEVLNLPLSNRNGELTMVLTCIQFGPPEEGSE